MKRDFHLRFDSRIAAHAEFLRIVEARDKHLYPYARDFLIECVLAYDLGNPDSSLSAPDKELISSYLDQLLRSVEKSLSEVLPAYLNEHLSSNDTPSGSKTSSLESPAAKESHEQLDDSEIPWEFMSDA